MEQKRKHTKKHTAKWKTSGSKVTHRMNHLLEKLLQQPPEVRMAEQLHKAKGIVWGDRNVLPVNCGGGYMITHLSHKQMDFTVH